MNNPSDYPDLIWSINDTRILSLPATLPKKERAILSLINDKIKILKDLGCEGIQEKFKKFDQVNAETYLAELVVAESFIKRGHRVFLLGSDCFPRASPDILVKTSNGDLFVEVAYMSSSDPGSILIDELRRIVEKYPYIINFSFAADVSLPHHRSGERDSQLEKLERSVEQFDAELSQIRSESFPYRGKTDAFSYEIIEEKPSGKGYPAVLTSSCSTSLDYSYAYLTLRLRKKGEKRVTFPSNKRGIPYVIAIVCDEPGIDSSEVEYLLYGDTIQYDFSIPHIPKEVKEKLKNKRGTEINQKVTSQSSWTEIQMANEKGWGDLLSRTYLLPHDYCYVDKPGLFFTEEIMRQVSGVLFYRCTGACCVFPNPFSIDKMDYSPFWEKL